MEFSDYIIYADESGDASRHSVDSDYPLFVLAFCLIKKSDYVGKLVPSVQQLKLEYFGHDDVILHESEIRRNQTPFAFLRDPKINQRFMHDLVRIIRTVPFEVIAAIVDKRGGIPNRAVDPYEAALESCLRRTLRMLEHHGQKQRVSHLIIEARGKKENAELLAMIGRFFSSTAASGNSNEIEVRLANKQVNSIGLQLADLVARPIGVSHLRPRQSNRASETIREKIRGDERALPSVERIEVLPWTAKDLGR